MATNQNEEFAQMFYAWWRITQQTFLKQFCQNTCNETAIKADFHFSYYKSTKTFKLPQQPKYICNSNKNNMFVEANAMNISSKFQHYLPIYYSF